MEFEQYNSLAQEALEEILLFEKESVYVTFGPRDDDGDLLQVDGIIRLVKRIDAPFITWTPRETIDNESVPAMYRRKVEIDLRDLKCYKRDQQKIGHHFSYIVFILKDGSTYSPMEFRMGGTKALIDLMKSFLHITKVPNDNHMYLVRLFDQDALYQSFDQLDLFDDNSDSKRTKAADFVFPSTKIMSLPKFGMQVTSFLRDSLVGLHPVSEGDVDIRHQIREDLNYTAIKTTHDSGFEVITKESIVHLPDPPSVQRSSPVNRDVLSRFINKDGRITCEDKLKEKIFRGGLENELRPMVWKYLLNYYIWTDTEQQNEERRKLKVQQYYQIKGQWQSITEDQERRFTLFRDRKNLIDKDVHRTDRTTDFFKNREDGNLNILYDILMTYTMYNFDLGYVQGMNDLLAPVLLIMKDEADAFWCFSGLMDRMAENFTVDQLGMKKQFSQLHILLHTLDPEFCTYLEDQKSDEFFFCFRWLLVHFKREFHYNEILRLWEILWTDLPCYNFHLLIALAILNGQKSTMMESKFGFNEILKHTNDLAYHIDLKETLVKAEAMWLQLKMCWSELSDDVKEILSFPNPNLPE